MVNVFQISFLIGLHLNNSLFPLFKTKIFRKVKKSIEKFRLIFTHRGNSLKHMSKLREYFSFFECNVYGLVDKEETNYTLNIALECGSRGFSQH